MRNPLYIRKMVLFAGVACYLAASCGIDHKNKEADEPKDNENSGDVIPGDSPNLTHESDPAKLAMTMALTINDDEPHQLNLKVVTTKDKAILVMPEDDTVVRIQIAEDDTTKFFSTISFASMHERMRNKNVIVSYLDTYYREEGSAEDKLYGVDLHDPVKIPWENVDGIVSFDHQLQTKGIGGFNKEFEQGRTIQQQFFTFLLRDGVEKGADTILVCIPIVVEQLEEGTFVTFGPRIDPTVLMKRL